jgi:hypothetical protein
VKFFCAFFLSFCALSGAACSPQGKQEKSVSNQQPESQVGEATCPDNPKLDLRDCEFIEIRNLLKSKSSAQERYRLASAKCGTYDQTTINFCIGTLRDDAASDLLQAHGNAKPSPTVATYLDLIAKIDEVCTPDYSPEEGGSGYNSRVSFCKMAKYSKKIDKLNGSSSRK